MLGPTINLQDSKRTASALLLVCVLIALLVGAGTTYVTHLSVSEEINHGLQAQLEYIVRDCKIELIQDQQKLNEFLIETARVNRLEYCAFLNPSGKIVGRSSLAAGQIGQTWREVVPPKSTWSHDVHKTHRIRKREGQVLLGSIVIATTEPTWYGTASRITRRYFWFIVVPFAGICLAVVYTVSSVRPLADIDDQLSRAAVSSTVSDLPFRAVPQRSSAAAGWNRIVERLNSQSGTATLEQRLQISVDSIQQTKSDVVVNSLTDGICVTDGLGDVVFANRALYALFGMLSEENQLQGHNAVSVVDEHIGMPKGTAFTDSLTQSRSVIEEMSREVEGIGEQIIRVARHPLCSPDAEQAGHVWSFRDITQQTLAKRMRDQFLDSATHELRTPLANIKAYAETLASSDDTDVEQQKMFCNTINTEATRLARFIDDLLSISSFEVGSLALSLQQVDVDRMLREAIGKIQAQVEQRKIRFAQSLPEKLPYLRLDKDKFVAALVNLLGNAVKYTPEEGQVELRVTVKDSKFCIDIADSGVGISEADLPKIFDKFFRSPDPRVQQIEGTGLGLSLTQEIIRLHGGALTVTSKLNKGSVFSITLPC